MMNDMAELAKCKAEALTAVVTSDSRWQLEDELTCQVFGLTMYGYVCGFARMACFMDTEDIQQLATDQLTELGIGPKYAEGMLQAAYDEFMQEGNTIYSLGSVIRTSRPRISVNLLNQYSRTLNESENQPVRRGSPSAVAVHKAGFERHSRVA